MEQKAPEEKVLRKLLSEIIKGYSAFEYEGSTVHIKHFGHEEQSQLEGQYEEVFQKAKKQGLPTEKEAMEILKEQELWTEKEENELDAQKKYIDNLKDTEKGLIIPSQIESIKKDIEEAEGKYQELNFKRKSLLSETCEGYSKKKNNDYSLYLSFYRNAECNEKFFSEEEFDLLTKRDLNDLLQQYVLATEHLSIRNIKFLAINNMFNIYYNILGAKNIYKFFDKPVYECSFYQLNLLNYAKILNSIIENSEKMPDVVKKDPDKIFDFAEAQKKNKDIATRTADKQGASVVGATKKDMKDMGVSDDLAVSPFELAKKKGSLTIEDFQNFA